MKENIKWYFANDNTPGDKKVSQFMDSKFNIHKWLSFTREIIQNSYDAASDSNKPVIVKFDYNDQLTISDIPGGEELKDIIGRCINMFDEYESIATKQQYEAAYKILSQEKIVCLKISDYNTKGVKSGERGIDSKWGALVYHDGVSKKDSNTTAGSHGVGKKTAFMISPTNTVFYSTKNIEGNNLFQGKTILINWYNDKKEKKSGTGFFGLYDESAINFDYKIEPIRGKNLNYINDYFIRKNEIGTDVIILGLNSKSNPKEEIKSKIIIATLENFYVAILQKKLIVDVFGTEINNQNFNSVFNEYYEKVKSDSKNLKFGYLEDFLRVFQNVEPDEIFVNDELGSFYIYFDNESKNNKKIYTIVRSHGMKIKDINFYRAESYFTALVVVKGEKLNEFLRKLENAAHDDFVVSDDLKEEERERNNKILNAFYKLIENHIEQRTKIEVEDEQSLTGLNEMISFSGLVEKKENIKPKKKIPSKQKNLIKVRGTPEPGKNKRDRLNKERKRRNVTEKPSAISTRKEKGNTISLDDFTVAPTFIYNQKQNKYTMKCQPKVNIKNCEIIINAINSDGKKIKIDYIIDKVWDEEKDYVNDGSIVKNINFKKDKLKNIYISFKEKSKFQLITEIIGESDG